MPTNTKRRVLQMVFENDDQPYATSTNPYLHKVTHP